MVHKILIPLLLLTGCAGVPTWTPNPEECGSGKGLDEIMERKYICVEKAEPVRLPSYIELLELPPAKQKPVVAVYGFADKTGQRKSRDGIADFSTAVSQGGTEMMIDALKTAGGGTWFRVVERQGIDNLVRERQIVRSTRKEYADDQSAVAPLLFAGMIIEGGVIGYDTNLQTGGRGARTLGIGFSRQYRQDSVTVSIRAVSVLTGEVLLNVQSRKTIMSYGAAGDLFRFYEQGTQLIEYEDGVGNNESVTYAVRTAIEAGVLELIYQGHDRGLWKIRDGHRHPHQHDGKNDGHPIGDSKQDE
jgi:curli production assembly/transport component CsgG